MSCLDLLHSGVSAHAMGYVIAVLLPLSYQGIPNPVGVWWQFRHDATAMPASVLKVATRVGNGIPFVSQAVLAVALWFISNSVSMSAADDLSTGWTTAAAIGMVIGCGWLAVYGAIYRLTQRLPRAIERHQILRRSVFFWIPLSVSSAIVEEVWRRSCLVALASEGSAKALVVMAIACGIGHGLPIGRFVSATVFALLAGELFLSTQTLWATIPAHTVVNLGTVWLVHFMRGRETLSR
jgi:hypothetical protein